MPERKPSLVIKDMLTCVSHIQQFTDSISFEEFSSNYMIAEACLYNIQVIGEAVARIPDDIKSNNPQIPWQLIKGMRNRLIHEYFGTDLELVWNVVKNELPLFGNELERIYSALGTK